MTNNIYTIKKGEKYPIQITLTTKDEHGEKKPIDLTGSIIKFQIKDELKDDFYIIDKIISTETDAYLDGRILDPTKGEFIIKFTDEDYDKLLEERIYYIIIKWEKPDEDFSKVVSSNGDGYLMFKVCYP